MHTSIRRHLHLCPRGRGAAAWCGTLILALAPATARAGTAGASPHSAWSTPLASAVNGAKPTPRTPRHPPPKSCANTNLQPISANLALVDAATFCLIQQVRAAHGLQPLRVNRPLQSVATAQTQEMVVGNYFGDDSISGETPMQRILATPYPGGATRVNSAQNIGWATGPLATPAAMVAAWMSSRPHRAIILTPSFRDIGVGVTPAAPSSLSQGLAGATYTLELGQRVFAARSARRRGY
jgi:uncharacterized protein YkwD